MFNKKIIRLTKTFKSYSMYYSVSQRRLEQIPELIILTNFKSFKNLKLKRKERKRKREHIIYNKYNMCAC
jgi:hypothetical protein